jgi:shikimate kinase
MSFVLIGFKGCGKTTYGKALSSFLECPFFDTDELIRQAHFEKTQQDQSISAVFEQLQEKAFRDLETAILKNLNPSKKSVIATGGGSILREENQVLIKKLGKVIFLDTPWEQIQKRIPAFFGNCIALDEYGIRKRFYENLADLTL